MKVTRPLLRYFGGKWQLRHWIIEHLPKHKFYAEPFAGAASVLLAKEPAPAGEIINDLNRETINLFRVMQDRAQSEELQRRLEWTPYAKAELDLSQQPTQDSIEQARRLVVRSFMGIEVAGMKGTSEGVRKTGFRMGNVDLSRVDQVGNRTFRNCAKDWANWKNALEAIRLRLGQVMIYERDAFEFMMLMDSPDCLQYIDPPYDHATRTYARYAVDFDRHGALVELLLKLKSNVVLSGYDCDLYRELEHAGWKKVSRQYRANMSTRPRTECLWIKPANL